MTKNKNHDPISRKQRMPCTGGARPRLYSGSVWSLPVYVLSLTHCVRQMSAATEAGPVR